MLTEPGWIPLDCFGTRLAILRQRLGWNRDQAARECGLNVNTWTKWEREGTLPRNAPEVVNKIVSRTGCDREWLMWGGALAAPEDVRSR